MSSQMSSQVGWSCIGPKDMALIMSARGVSLCQREAVDTHIPFFIACLASGLMLWLLIHSMRLSHLRDSMVKASSLEQLAMALSRAYTRTSGSEFAFSEAELHEALSPSDGCCHSGKIWAPWYISLLPSGCRWLLDWAGSLSECCLSCFAHAGVGVMFQLDFTHLRRYIGLPRLLTLFLLTPKPMYDMIWQRFRLHLMYDTICRGVRVRFVRYQSQSHSHYNT